MSRDRHHVWLAYRPAIPFVVAALVIATSTHAVVFTASKGGVPATRGEGSSRAIVTRREWDMSGSGHIPEWLVLLSQKPKTSAPVANGSYNRTKLSTRYRFDGNFLGFGIRYNTGHNWTLMLANFDSILRASNVKGVLLGYDLVNERPRLSPTNTSWHCLQDGFQWNHLFTFGTTNLGIFRLTYEPWNYIANSQGEDGPHNTCKQPASLLSEDGPIETARTAIRQQSRTRDIKPEQEEEDEKPIDTNRPSFRPRPRTSSTTTTSEPTTTYDIDGFPEAPPLPDKWWRKPKWVFTNPGVSNEGKWVYPERPLLEKNCWAYSYASYSDGSSPGPRDPRSRPRFWARWPVKPVQKCKNTRPWCKFTFDRERAIPTGDNSEPDTMQAYPLPCPYLQDEGAPILCSEDKNWSDQSDPNKMELSYMIHAREAPIITENATASDGGSGPYCNGGSSEEFWALNLQNLTFILKNPLFLDRKWLSLDYS